MAGIERERLGLVHVYCGDGKGKTTAAMGLCLRMLGSGGKVVVTQFLKDGSSGEMICLRKLGVKTLFCPKPYGFTFAMSSEQKAECRSADDTLLKDAFRISAEEETDLLVLDEAIGAVNAGIIEENTLLRFLDQRPKRLEVVLTGRNPSWELLARADYVSEIHKGKHPFDCGVQARRGVER